MFILLITLISSKQQKNTIYKNFISMAICKVIFTVGHMLGVIKVKPQKEGSNLSNSSNNNKKHVDTMGPTDDGGTLGAQGWA
jgi:hypothetical protein